MSTDNQPVQPSRSAQPNFTGMPAGGPHAHLFKEKVKLKDTRATTRRVLAYLAKRKSVLVLVFATATVTTLIGIVGTRLNGYAVDEFIATGDLDSLARLCLILIGLYLIYVGSTYLQNILMVSTAQKTAAHIRHDLFTNLQRLPLRYLDAHASGDLMSRLTNDVDNISVVLSQSVVQLFSGVVMIVGMLAAMLLLSWPLTLIAITTMPLMFVGTRLLARTTQPYFVNQQRELGLLNGTIEETISGQKVIKLFGQEDNSQTAFAAINQRLTRSAIMAQGLSGIMGPLNNVINNLTYLMITVAGAFLILRGYAMTVGIVFTFLLYMRNFTRPINDIMNLFNTIQSALAGAERVFEVMDEPKEQDRPGAVPVTDITGKVELEQVGFAYVAGKPVLHHVTIQAEPGQTVAIVGPTGAGKTTIINLLTKFYDYDSGQVRIDGTDIRNLTTASLRQNIAIVLQDPFLFSESVRENIRYGRLTATDEEVEAAARQARAHDFILQLPEGYETVLRDNGGNLSQGQRQLLSIARAIIARASVLILDEATSSIDTRTEILIQGALLELMKGRTSFVIAHRLSTIRNADQIVVINDGRVAEAGTHDQLIAGGGFYATLYNSQFKTGMSI